MGSIQDKRTLFEVTPVPKALATMAAPTVVSQLINLVYNLVDTFFIGRVGNPYMTAATTLVWTLIMLSTALANLYGVGGGSLIARLLGAKRDEEARNASAFTVFCAIGTACGYSLVLGVSLKPLLSLLGASAETIGYASQYTMVVLVAGNLPMLLAAVLAHLIRNAGYANKASIGLSGGGLLNIVLDPLLMFVVLPQGWEVTGAALATLISNIASCLYLLVAYRRAGRTAPLSMSWSNARKTSLESRKKVFSVGVPSAVLTALFDLANVCANRLAAIHGDSVLAGLGIVMKVERIPTAVNLGICHGALPIVAYNFASKNQDRMKKTIRTARLWGLFISAAAILLFLPFAEQIVGLFMKTGIKAVALETVATATFFLRFRCLASPMQFINYHTSYSLQAMGNGRATVIHAVVRELLLYIPLMILLDHFFGQTGLALALLMGESCGAVFAILVLRREMIKAGKTEQGGDR